MNKNAIGKLHKIFTFRCDFLYQRGSMRVASIYCGRRVKLRTTCKFELDRTRPRNRVIINTGEIINIRVTRYRECAPSAYPRAGPPRAAGAAGLSGYRKYGYADESARLLGFELLERFVEGVERILIYSRHLGQN